MPTPEIVRLLERLGGVASRAELRASFMSRTISAAVREGLVVRDAPGRYALPSAPRAAVRWRTLDPADGRAQNPFESVLRALSLDVPGLDLTQAMGRQEWVRAAFARAVAFRMTTTNGPFPRR